VNARTSIKNVSLAFFSTEIGKRELSLLSLSLTSQIKRATRRQKYERRSFVSLRSFFKPKSTREERRKRESKRARRTVVRPFSVFS
jgi:hypothetical protein